MSKRILVAEDDDKFREALKHVLEEQGYAVAAVGDGRSALQLATLESFDAVITDIRMPEMNGIQLLHSIREKLKIPVILMTGFSELAETHEAIEMGAAGFFAKPFRQEDLLAELRVLFALPSEPQVRSDTPDENFCRLRIDDFVQGRNIQFDIWVRLAENRFVKIAHGGQDLSIDRIRSYKSKNIQYLYLEKSDFRKYVGFSVTVAGALRKSTIDKSRKMNFLKHTGEVVLENLHLNGVNEESFFLAKDMIESTVAIVSDEDDLFSLLTLLNDHSDHIYAHSLGVALYSTVIARELKWTSATTRFKLALGGLFHDVGKKELGREIIDRPRRDLTAEEIRLLESHPTRGADILASIGSIQGDILLIVKEHHENLLGQGYPLGLKKKQIHPLARVVSVANEFCNLVIRGPSTVPLSPEQAMQRLKTLHVGALDAEMILALGRSFRL
ncbi:MAG: response regulator [Oligoflexia bacterium]|nr:response regulator [Oligoflexia bacterium]